MAIKVFSSESVTEGHPDKLCDKVSDAVLDAALKQDPESRVACETAVKKGMLLAGEITTKADLDLDSIARKTVTDIGYTYPECGFDANTFELTNWITTQSPDISQGVTVGEGDYKEQGAGDQGMMFGYAVNETPELMPLPISLAHKLTKRLTDLRKNSGVLSLLRPDGKSQVAVLYDDGKPIGLKNVIISTQHKEINMRILRDCIYYEVIMPICEEYFTTDTRFLINPTGRFVVGGPEADAGLTGRKIIVDTYGGRGRHGGGAFSGKDPSKVDRSAAYAARYIAKNLVASGLAYEVEVQLAYAIGVAEPTSIMVETYGTSKLLPEKLADIVKENFPTKPADIISELGLKNPEGWNYYDTAANGHFGRNQFPWEKLDKVEQLKQYL